ncbi:hypothetical protein [Okeania sp. SIO1F9]|uniref:hypothetical protein n=1 Tax=Okeania sp. SIO1F9 TaxID=2607813 RepID=UPI001450C53F|nr:hypothetical protein [Okeania sp. SIO1F9]NET79033.1 hypothetical protein [Okeania sp. SIO1F9]
MGEGKRQPTPRPSPSQEGKTGVRRNGNYRGGRKKSCPKIVLPLFALNTNMHELFIPKS